MTAHVAPRPSAIRATGPCKSYGDTVVLDGIDLLTGEENLHLMADLHHLERGEGRRRSAALLERFDLVDAARTTPFTYPGGMRRQLDLATTLVGDPRVIFLDEPRTGLDPRTRRTLWDIIRDLVAGGVTILLTTRNLEEADELADRIALLDHGTLGACRKLTSRCHALVSGPGPGAARGHDRRSGTVSGAGPAAGSGTLIKETGRVTAAGGPRRRRPRPRRGRAGRRPSGARRRGRSRTGPPAGPTARRRRRAGRGRRRRATRRS